MLPSLDVSATLKMPLFILVLCDGRYKYCFVSRQFGITARWLYVIGLISSDEGTRHEHGSKGAPLASCVELGASRDEQRKSNWDTSSGSLDGVLRIPTNNYKRLKKVQYLYGWPLLYH